VSSRKYLPIKQAPGRRPFIPEAPIPVLPKLARAVRDAMGGGVACVLSLGPRTANRIRSMMQAEEKREIADKLAAAARAAQPNVDVDVVIQGEHHVPGLHELIKPGDRAIGHVEPVVFKGVPIELENERLE